jgi:AcrR family transcriptional regulator
MLGTPNRDRTSERRAATRREIIDAAWEVAREQGLAQLTLRDIAERVGMKAPSLYSHVDSKNAIYDAMFGQAWTECREVMLAMEARCPPDVRGALQMYARTFFDFSVSDLTRFQLMNQRTIPGFQPSPEAYSPALLVIQGLRDRLATFAITAQEDIDLFVALVGGLADAQLANDPGGDRWSRLLDRAVDMYVRDLGIDTTAPLTPTQEGTTP